MVKDLPDYTKREVLVIDISDFPQEVMIDHRKILGVALKTPTVAQCLPTSIEHIVQIDHQQIKGLTLKDPTVPLSVPVSWEGPYLAYEPCLDAWKVQIVEWPVTALSVSLANDWTRQLGLIDLSRVLGAALSHANPVISRLTDGSAFIDPRDISDRAARLLGIIYGDKGQLAQRTTSLDAYVALRYSGAEIDPRDIRALTVTDIVTAKQSDETLLKATVTQAAKDRTVTGTVTAEQATAANLKATVTQASIARTVTGTVTAEQATAANLKATVEQATAASLNATVTQLAKDRTVSSVDATATAYQISLVALNGNSAAIVTPAGGKALRLKFISLEQSAAVDIGYRFGAAGTIYYLRTTAGVYVSNLIGCNNQGAADAALYLNSSGATNVKGYILVTEV